VNRVGAEEIPTSPIKGEVVSERVATIQEVTINKETSSFFMELGESGEGAQEWYDIYFIPRWLNNEFLVDGPTYL